MDINALRDRLNQLNRRTSTGGNKWKPKDEHQVRLVPNPHSPDPFQELHFHYELGDTFELLCPKMNYGDDCEICDFADALKAWKSPDGNDKPERERKADFEIFKKIQAKAKVFAPMIERANKEKNIAEMEAAHWWGMTPAQVTQAIETCLDGDRLEELGIDKDDGKNALKVLFDPKKGYDLMVSFAKPGEKGNNKTFTQITIKGRIKPSALSKDESVQKKILESVKKLDEIFPRVTSEEAAKVLKKFLAAGASEAKAEGGTEKYAGKSEKPVVDPPKDTNSKESAKLAGTRSIDEAFGEMLAEDA